MGGVTMKATELPRTIPVLSLETDAALTWRYAELTADFNPIHIDPEFAAGTSFGGPILHGTMGLNLLVEAVAATFGRPMPALRFDIRFIRPAPVGAVIRAGGELSDPDNGVYSVFVETADGQRTVEGTCSL